MSILQELVEKQVAASIINVVGRRVDAIAEKMAEDLLKDLDTRTKLILLINAAFDKALKDLAEE